MSFYLIGFEVFKAVILRARFFLLSFSSLECKRGIVFEEGISP